jgi:hypothetical protein
MKLRQSDFGPVLDIGYRKNSLLVKAGGDGLKWLSLCGYF